MASTALTKEQSQLVIESWELAKKDSATHSFTFISKIFEIGPGAKPMFSFLRDPEVPFDKNPKLKAHALTVFNLTGDSASMLGEKGAINALHPKLKALGKRHVGYGVIAAHFDVVKSALLITIESLLPEGWPAEKKMATYGAWSKAYDELASVMIDEMQIVRDAQASANIEGDAAAAGSTPST